MSDERGFTLVELMISLVVLGIIGVSAVRLLISDHQTLSRQNTAVEANQNVRAGVDMLIREIRNAGYDPREAGAGLTAIRADSVAWTADLNADGDLLDSGADGDESVAYWFDAGTGELIREGGGVESPVADGVDSLRFTYLDADGATTADPDAVEQVRVQLWYRTAEGAEAGALESQAALRNAIYGR